MLASFRIGLLLYLIQALSAVLCSVLLARIRYTPPIPSLLHKERTESGGLLGAIRRSSLSCLCITGSVCFFSALIALIGIFIKDATVRIFLSAFLEIGTATAEAASLYSTSPSIALCAICIAVVFGGASVHLQTALFLPRSKELFLYYIGAKLCQTAISVALLFLFLPFFK